MRQKLKKGIIIFFVVIATSTLLSRIVNNMYIAKVEVAVPISRTLEKKLVGVGEIQGGHKTLVKGENGLLVTDILVKVGEQVKVGDILYRVDIEDTAKLLAQKEAELEVLRLQLQGEIENQTTMAQTKEMEEIIAKENYNAATIAKKVELEKIQSQVEIKKGEKLELEKQIQIVEEQNMSTEYENDEQLQTESREDLASLQQKLDAMIQDIEILQNSYTQQELALTEQVRIAEQSVRQAGITTTEGVASDITKVSIEQLEEKIEPLATLLQTGNVVAPSDGIVESIGIVSGSRTVDGANIVLTDMSNGVEVVAKFVLEDAKDLKETSLFTINTGFSASMLEEVPINSIRILTEEIEMIEVSLEIKNPQLLLGSNVEVIYKEESIHYQSVIPRNALYQEGEDEYFIYIMNLEETILGEEVVAKKMNVEVIDKNEDYVAVEGVNHQDRVIVESNKFIEEGSKIKVTTYD